MEKRIKEDFERLGISYKQINSGSFWHSKGDNRVVDLFLIECKTLNKEQKQHVIKKEWYEKIADECKNSKETSLVIFDFGDEYDIVSCQKDVFIDIVERLIYAENKLKKFENTDIEKIESLQNKYNELYKEAIELEKRNKVLNEELSESNYDLECAYEDINIYKEKLNSLKE